MSCWRSENTKQPQSAPRTQKRLGSAISAVSAVAFFFVGATLAASSDAPLADAVERMDRARIRTLLQRHADVNAPQADGMTALHWAAYQDDPETAGLLVRGGARVNAANRYGVTPPSPAGTNGSGALVEPLLKAGAD